MAKMTYKMQLASGITLNNLIIHNCIIPLSKDRVSPTVYENTTGRELYITADEVSVFVEAYGTMIGLEWTLEIKIEGEKLTDDPIKQEVRANGNAGLTKKYPW